MFSTKGITLFVLTLSSCSSCLYIYKYMLDVLYSLRDSVWIVFCRYQLNVKTAGGEMWHAVSPTSSKLSVPCHNVKTRRCWIWTFSFTWFSCKLCQKGGVETQPDIPKSLSVNRKCFMYLFLPYVSLGSIFTVNDPLNKHVICIFSAEKLIECDVKSLTSSRWRVSQLILSHITE